MYFPKLERNKEYINSVRNYPDKMILAIIFSYIKLSVSHRDIEVKIMKTSNKGYNAMKVLHFFGITSKHKGIFKSKEIDEIIEILKCSEYDNEIIVELLSKLIVDKNYYLNRLFMYTDFFSDASIEFKEEVLEKELSKHELEAYYNSYMKVRNSKIQNKFRKKLLDEFNCKCAICRINNPKLLIASHILPYSKCNGDIKKAGNHNNGLLLCVLHDALFESGNFITFINGDIKINNSVPKDMWLDLNINKNIELDSIVLTNERNNFLLLHNEMFENKSLNKSF